MKCLALKGWVYRCNPRNATSKFATTLLILFCFQVHAQALGQGNITITLSVKDAPAEQVFRELKKQSGYGFVFPSEVLARLNRITLSVNKASLEEVLSQVFKGQPYTYSIIDKVVIIRPREVASALPIDVSGKVTNEKGEPLPGVTVTVKGTDKITSTDAGGVFTINSVDREAVLLFSSVNMEPFELRVNGKSDLAIRMKAKVRELDDVTVMVNTGYQKLPKERATGSFDFINTEEINRKTGVDILSRLEGVSTGVLFDRRDQSPNQNTVTQANILVRGLNTLTNSMKAPLIVVNNFPYEGDIGNINPNDVESITILKDAAAASIWGAKAGNGVVVITTKHGDYNQSVNITFNTNVQFTEKPGLFDLPKMSSREFVELETYLFNKDFYQDDLSNPLYPALSPVVEILNKRKSGIISAQDSASQIQSLLGKDVRNDFDQYIYRKGINQQYALNVSGGTQSIKYSFMGGYDKGESILKGDDFNRITFRTDMSVMLQKLEVNLGVAYANVRTNTNSIGNLGAQSYDYRPGKRLYPYASFANNSGTPTPIVKDYRTGYTDTAGGGKLLNWQYNPLDEIANSDKSIRQSDIVANLNLSYHFTKYLSVSGSYQYQKTNGLTRIYYSPQTYFARNLINLYTTIQDATTINNIPNSGMLDLNDFDITSHMGRFQVNYQQTLKGKHAIVGVLGAEVREKNTGAHQNRIYGFDESLYGDARVDYITRFTLYGDRGSAQIPYQSGISLLTDHFISAYVNAAYTYDDRYTISTSARKDASNLFGAQTNDKWKPFWTIGFAWNASNEEFFNTNAFSLLRVRGSYGYQGNVNNTLSPYTIIGYSPANLSLVNQPFAGIIVPANPGLSWERMRQLNIGLDFRLKNDRISGSIDVYAKKSSNLLWDAPIDITTGVGAVKKNSAGMTGKGFDLSLQFLIVKSKIRWEAEAGYSYITNKVTEYKGTDEDLTIESLAYGNGLNITALRGKSPYSIYSFPFAGLDPATGDPLGYLGKTVSNDYLSIFQQLYDTTNLVYHGSAIPTHFGYFNNIVRFKGLSLLINVNYKLGFYFRKSTISYSKLIDNGVTHSDYSKRWITPGDKKNTTIPSFIYPITDSRRDDFYAASDVNVLRGDHIRLQNIRLGYDFGAFNLNKVNIRSFNVYANLENIGILWRANDENLDPEYDAGNAAYPIPRRVALGVRLQF